MNSLRQVPGINELNEHVATNYERDDPNESVNDLNSKTNELDSRLPGHVIASTAKGGEWNEATTWLGGTVPEPNDDVEISRGASVTISKSSAACENISIGTNATLTISAGLTLQVSGNWINNGTFNATASTVTFIGTTNSLISGSSSTIFYNITVDKGLSTSTILEATGSNGSAASNTGHIILANGLFKLTAGRFQFTADPLIPTTAGLWVNGATVNSVSSADGFSIHNNGLIRISAGILNVGSHPDNELNNGINGIVQISGGTLNIAGRFNNNSGSATINGGTVNISTIGNSSNDWGSFHVGASANLAIDGNPSIIIHHPNEGSGGDIVILQSSGLKTINGGKFQLGGATSSPGIFIIHSEVDLYDLSLFSKLAKASLTGSDLTVNNRLSLEGQLVLNDQNLVLGPGAHAVAGTLGASHGLILINGRGEARKIFTTSFAYLFPVGTSATAYSPLDLNFTAGTYASGAFAGVRTSDTKFKDNPGNSNYLNRYWTIHTEGINNPVYNVEATYLQKDVVGSEAKIKVGEFRDNSSILKYKGLNTATHTLMATGVQPTGSITTFTSVALADATTTTVTSDSNPSCEGATVTFTATVVTTGSVTPTGTIEFFDGATSLGTVGVATTGDPQTVTALLSTATLTPGAHIISANYSGDLDNVGSSANLTQNVTASPIATFSYTGSPYCQDAANPLPTFSGGGAAGTFTSTAGLVFVDSNTGQINLSASTPGTYTVTNTIAAANGCPDVTATSSIIITAPPMATFSYTGSPYCQDAANPLPTFSGGGAAGTFTSTAGLVFVDSNTGQINLSASTPGTYTVTNTIAGVNGCADVTASSSITITALPVATFNYAGSPYCQGGTNPLPTFSGGGSAGTFTSTAGLVFVDSNTGQINLSVSTPGTYTVTNTIAGVNGCADVTASSSITITALPVATFNYAGSPYCQGGTNPLPTFSGGGSAGTFTSTAGLVFVDSNTGQINLSVSTPGTYTVTNTIAGVNGCADVTASSSITITALPVATFNYAGSPYCQGATNPLPTFSGGGSAGTFTSTAGLVFVDSNTGQIDLSASTPGTYTVTNTIAAANGCPDVTATSSVTITTAPTAAISYAAPFCASLASPQSVTLTGTGAYTGGTFSSTAGLTIDPSTGAITPSTSTAGTYTVTYTIPAAGGCAAFSTTTSVTITAVPTATISYAGTPFCTSVATAQPVTLTGTGAYTGGTFSSTAGLSINSSTGAITPSTSTAGTYTITYTIPASGGCAAVPVTTSVTIKSTPAVTASATSTTLCSGNSDTLSATCSNCGATSPTYSWNPASDFSVSSGSPVIAFPSATTTYTVTATNPNGCVSTATVTINVNQSPAGTLSNVAPVCASNNSGTITLSNYTGTIVQWEVSTDGGTTWNVFTPSTPTTTNFSNLTTTTAYRVLLTLNGCSAYTNVGVVPVQPVFTPTVTASPTSICLGQSSVLQASNYGPPPFPVEDFQNANPAGWSGNNANSNNGDPNAAWAETNGPKTFSGVTYNSNAVPTNTKFMIATGDGGGSATGLITPPFSLVGVTSPTFNFYTAMNLNFGASAKVQISTDGGLTFTTLQTWTGPAAVGTPNGSGAGWQQVSINLSSYIGQPNVRVRFLYSGNTGSNWGVDNVGLSGTYQPVTYQWSPSTYLTPSDTSRTVTSTPTVPGSYQYCVVATTASGCVSNPVCATITVNALPVVTTVNSCIGGGTVTFTQTAGATGGTWKVSGGGTINASTGVFTPTAAGCFTATYTTPAPGCTDTKNFVVFPAAPVLVAPANSCNTAFALPTVPAVAGFTIQFSIDGGAFSASPTIPTATGCHTIQAQYVLTNTCGSTPAGTATMCLSNIVNVVIFPPAPVLATPDNTCNAPFTLPAVTPQSGFTIQYSIDGGAFADIPTVPTTPGCHTVQAQYVLGTACGGIAAGTASPAACASNVVSVVIFPTAPNLTAPANSCNTSFTLPTVAAVAGFSVQYSIDGAAYSNAPGIPNTPGCHTIQARYALTTTCGTTAAGSIGADPCGASNIVNTVIFPAAPAAPIVNGGCGAIVVTAPPAIAGFNIQYSFDDGASWGTNTPPTADNCSGYSIRTRYVLSADCGSALAGAVGANGCDVSPATIRKIDNTPPEISCPVVAPVCQVAGDLYTIPTLVTSDNCTANSNLLISFVISRATTRSGSGIDASGNFSVGISTITWTVTDECGNANTCTTQVTIFPKPTPIIYHN